MKYISDGQPITDWNQNMYLKPMTILFAMTLATTAAAELSREDAMHRAGELDAVINYCTDETPDELWNQSSLMMGYVNVGDEELAIWESYDNGIQVGAQLVINNGCSVAIADLSARLDDYHY